MTTSAAWIGSAQPGWTVEQGRRHFLNRKELNTRGADEQVLSLTLRGVVRNDPDAPEGLVPTDYNSYQVFGKDDLVFKLIDLENRRTSRVGLVPERGIMSPAYIRLIPKDTVLPRYAYWYYYSLWTRDVFNELGAGVRATLNSADLLALPIALPPVEEQRRIADFLDDQVARIDLAMTCGAQQAADAEAALKGRIVETFFAFSNLVVPLRAVALVAHGMQRSPDRMLGPSMCRYVRTANVKDGVIETTDLNEMNFSPPEQVVYGLRRGDVLVTEASGSRSAVGASAMWTEDSGDVVCFQNHLLRLRPRDANTDPRYLEWWARASHMSGAMEMWATGANILNLGSEQLKRMPIPQRNLNEQMNVAQRCYAIESSGQSAIDEFKRRRDLLEERKRALITAAVTGELDVTTARPIGMGKWVPNVGATVEAPASAQASSIGGIG